MLSDVVTELLLLDVVAELLFWSLRSSLQSLGVTGPSSPWAPLVCEVKVDALKSSCPWVGPPVNGEFCVGVCVAKGNPSRDASTSTCRALGPLLIAMS